MNDVQLRATRVVRSDSAASDSTYTTVNETLCIVVVEGNTPDCLAAQVPPPSSGPRLLSYTTDRVTTNRKTGESVDMPKWGGNVNGDTSVQRSGMAYKWPIDAQKKTYQFFSPDLKKAFPATFEGTSTIKGLTVYQYVSETGKQPFQINGTFPGTYDDTRTVYVEPRTGAIIKGIEHQVQTLQNGQVALDTTLQFDDQSIGYQAHYAQTKIDQLRLAQLWGPLIAGILGLLLVVGGLLLLRRGRAPRTGAHARDPGAPTDDDGRSIFDPQDESSPTGPAPSTSQASSSPASPAAPGYSSSQT